MVRNRGILTYACVLALALGGAGAMMDSTDESAAPVVQTSLAPASAGDAAITSSLTD